MKPRESGGVVDKHLSVYGTQNLKVAGTSPSVHVDKDMSICTGGAGNTYSIALMIGEKAAEIIASEPGI